VSKSILLIVLLITSGGLISSTVFVAFGAPLVVKTEYYCDNTYHSDGTLKTSKCCSVKYGKSSVISKTCYSLCYDQDGHMIQCPKNTKMEGTFNPGITGGAGAGVLQDKNKNNSKDTNIDNNAGVLQDDNTTNSSNNTLRQSFEKNGNPLVDKNIFRNNGAGVAPYAGDSSTWCKDIGGQKVCTCNGGTDCLHCRDTGMPCTDTSKLPATIK